MKIDLAMVETLARLARLELSSDERQAFAEQLPKILEYVGQLEEVQVEAVSEVPKTPSAWRLDEAQPSSASDDILGQAPEREDRFWKVRSVFS